MWLISICSKQTLDKVNVQIIVHCWTMFNKHSCTIFIFTFPIIVTQFYYKMYQLFLFLVSRCWIYSKFLRHWKMMARKDTVIVLAFLFYFSECFLISFIQSIKKTFLHTSHHTHFLTHMKKRIIFWDSSLFENKG